MHAIRTRLALARLKRRDWPFPGRIGIREQDWSGAEETHVFDRWYYLGTAQVGVEPAGFEPRARKFDADIYRILLRTLERPVRGMQMIELDQS